MKKHWYEQAVIYQIYPRSFKDSNNDGIGDLQGIIDKLDYLNDGTKDSLGIGAIWISPFYPSPMKDFGYDISNYCDVDPIFGSLETFDKLIIEAHKRNIKIIIDFVTNHTSSEHPWFKESRSSKDNPKRDWYVWRDPKEDGSAPNNWLSIAGGSDWALDEKTGQYYLHHFLPEQPDLNWRNPEVVAEMKKVLTFWLERGVDGFRVDALNHIIEDKNFRDNPLNESFVEGKDNPYNKFTHTFSQHQPELRSVVEILSETVNQYPEKFIVTESYLDMTGLAEMYSWAEKKNYAPFNFNLIGMDWSARSYRTFIDAFDAALLPQEIPTYVLGNHDQSRIASRLGVAQARASALILLTLRGLPFIYYGEELGMENGVVATNELKDAFAISNGSTSRDPERTPMQWTGLENAGFSSGKPWLPVAGNYEKINVLNEKNDPQSMLTLYRTLIQFRDTSSTLLEGSYRSLKTKSADIFAYVREHGNEKLIVAVNFSDQPVTEDLEGAEYELLISTSLDREEGQHISGDITLRPFEGVLLHIKA